MGTRRRVSTTWSRRRRNQLCRSPQALLSVAAPFKHVGRIQRSHVSCIRTRVFAQARWVGLPGDSAMHVSVHLFLSFSSLEGTRVWRVVEAVGKTVSRWFF